MRLKKIKKGLVFYVVCASKIILAEPLLLPLSLKEVILHALKHHPEIQAAHYHELSQEEKITEAASVYYPHISAQALYANGLPGSAAATSVEGLVVSPFHKGPVAGIIVTQTIWDFGRTYDQIGVAKSQVALAKADTQAVKVPIVQKALESYYACSRDKKMAAVFNDILQEARMIEHEVDRFFQSSQRSEVEKNLAESQSAEIQTIALDSQKKYEIELKRLLLLTGLNSNSVCPEMGELLIQEFEASPLGEKLKEETIEKSPFIQQSQAHIQLSLKEKDLAFDEHYPKIMGVAGYGYIQNTWANIPLSHYSVAIGMVIPLFEGFKTSAHIESAQAKLLSHESHLAGTRLNVNAANIAFDKKKESSQIRIKNFKSEVHLAVKAFKTAKKRYFTYQGNLIDLRESLKNLTRTQHQFKIAEFDYLISSVEKALINGGIEKFTLP